MSVSSSIVISLAPLKGIHGFNFLDTDLTHLSGWFIVYTCLTRRSHGSKYNSLLLTLRQSLPQVAVYFLATVLSSALARCHRNFRTKMTTPQKCRGSLHFSFLLKQIWRNSATHMPHISTLHTCRKRTNSFCKGGWTSEFATSAVAGTIDLDSRYAGPLRVIRNEEWDENNGYEGWKILWLHSDCSARSLFWSVAHWDLAVFNLAFLLEICLRMASLVWRIVEAFLWLNPS